MNSNISRAIAGVMPAALRTGLFVSLCTIQAPDQLPQGPTGNPPGTYSNVAGAVDVPSMKAPEGWGHSISDNEQRTLQQIISGEYRHELLGKCFLLAEADPYLPAQKGWAALGYRAVVDGVIYDIRGAQNDSQKTQTRLLLELVKV